MCISLPGLRHACYQCISHALHASHSSACSVDMRDKVSSRHQSLHAAHSRICLTHDLRYDLQVTQHHILGKMDITQVWGRCEALTAGLSSDLAEQLRLVLEPQLASKMAGEYRSGKRISMKRVIAYIASHFRKDKIWLRRTRPDKRKYQASFSPLCAEGHPSSSLLPRPDLPLHHSLPWRKWHQ